MSAAADQLVMHLIRRLQRDPRVAYHFDPITESFQLLTAAYAELRGENVEDVRKRYADSLTYEAPRCRRGRCAERTEETA